MTNRLDRDDAVRALLEGIASAHHAVNPTVQIPWDSFSTYAHAALGSLESAGFEVIRRA